jgi:hypothetical protein
MTSAHIAHQARLISQQTAKKQQRPLGNYDHGVFQWGVVHAIHAGPPPSVDVYLDGTHNTGNAAYLTPTVPYLANYVPTVGDTVLVRRGEGRSASDRTVICKLNGSASPYPVPLGGIDASGRFVQMLLSAWGATAVPSNSMGANGDWCFSANGHIYFKATGVWGVKV